MTAVTPSDADHYRNFDDFEPCYGRCRSGKCALRLESGKCCAVPSDTSNGYYCRPGGY